MKLFDPLAELAKIQNPAVTPANPAIIANRAPRLAGLARLAASEPENLKTGKKAADAEPPLVWALMDRFRERRASLEHCEALDGSRAAWLSALAAFVLPSEREAYFEGYRLIARYQQTSFAIREGVAVTFHQTGRVSIQG